MESVARTPVTRGRLFSPANRGKPVLNHFPFFCIFLSGRRIDCVDSGGDKKPMSWIPNDTAYFFRRLS
jgi:hypothetical protein